MKKRRQNKRTTPSLQKLSAADWVELVFDASEGRRLKAFRQHFTAIKRGQASGPFIGYDANFLTEALHRARAKGHKEYLNALALAVVEADLVR